LGGDWRVGPTRARQRQQLQPPALGAARARGGGCRSRQGEPAGPRGRAGLWGASWAAGARGAGWAAALSRSKRGGATRWAARRKRAEKGLGGVSIFPFFALISHLDSYFTNSLNHKQKDA
jgi:hypothetical protein